MKIPCCKEDQLNLTKFQLGMSMISRDKFVFNDAIAFIGQDYQAFDPDSCNVSKVTGATLLAAMSFLYEPLIIFAIVNA